MSRLLDIAVHPIPGAPMQRLSSVTITASGVAGDVPRTKPHRQVTVVAQAAWQRACADLGAEVPWTARRANLLVDGVELARTTGKRLRVGTVLLEITGETKPCGTMDKQHFGLQAALTPDWRAGVTCHVLEPGEIKVGDAVELL
jgi:MOSC domain-containing protein YiiM